MIADAGLNKMDPPINTWEGKPTSLYGLPPSWTMKRNSKHHGARAKRAKAKRKKRNG